MILLASRPAPLSGSEIYSDKKTLKFIIFKCLHQFFYIAFILRLNLTQILCFVLKLNLFERLIFL